MKVSAFENPDVWKVLPLSFALRRCQTFYSYVVDENSPTYLKRKTYTAYTVGENSPLTFKLLKFHGVRRGWKFTHDSFFESMGEFSPRAYEAQKSDFKLFHNNYFTNVRNFLPTRGEKK